MSSERENRRRRREEKSATTLPVQDTPIEDVGPVLEALEERVTEALKTPEVPKEAKAKQPPRKRKEGVTLKHLKEAAKLLGAQSSGGARGYLQRQYPREEHKALALALMQLTARRVLAENRKRVLLRDVELVLGLLQEVFAIQKHLSEKVK